jgi:hypothetical protein
MGDIVAPPRAISGPSTLENSAWLFGWTPSNRRTVSPKCRSMICFIKSCLNGGHVQQFRKFLDWPLPTGSQGVVNRWEADCKVRQGQYFATRAHSVGDSVIPQTGARSIERLFKQRRAIMTNESNRWLRRNMLPHSGAQDSGVRAITLWR